MSKHFRVANVVLIGAVAVASAGIPIAPQIMGDTNEDCQIDILDLQWTIAQVLDGVVDDGRGDVNADGQVNVLDLQCIFEQAKAPAPAKKESPSKRDQRAVLERRREVLAGRVDGDRVPTVAVKDRPRGLRAVAPCEPPVGEPLRRARYGRHLTSHAPPLPA